MRPTSRSFRRSERQRGPVRLNAMERFSQNCKTIATLETRLVELIPQQVVDCGLCTGLRIDAFDDDGTGQIGSRAAVGQGLSGD
jgi:hypothetical protein